MALPYAMKQAGAVLGLILLLLIGYLSNYTLRSLIKAGRSVSCYDYEELTRHCFGHKGFMFVLVAILALDFGSMVSYIIVIGGLLPPVFEAVVGEGGLMSERWFVVVLVSAVLLLPLSLLRSLKDLTWVSMTSVGVIVVVIGIVGVEGLKTRISTSSVVLWGDQVFSSFGTIVFAYVCHDVSFQVFQSLNVPTQDRWTIVCHCAIMIALMFSILMALLGYFSFGEDTQENILDSFPPDNSVANVARLLLGVTLVFTYPLNLFMARHVVARVLGFSAASELNSKGHIIITLCLFTTSVVIGVLFPKLGVIQSLVGGLSGSIIAYIIPAACVLSVRKIDEGIPLFCRCNAGDLCLFVFGVVVMFASCIQTIYDAAIGDY